MTKKFRAYYKPDLDTPDGALKFEQVERNDELWFEYDQDIRYEFYIPFLDDGWVVHQYVGLDDVNGTNIYEGDIIKYQYPSDEEVLKRNSIECQNIVLVRFTEPGQDYHPGWITQNLWGQSGDIKIIGNIMETPELLKKN